MTDRDRAAPTPSPTQPALLLKPVTPFFKGGYPPERRQASKQGAPAPAPSQSSRGSEFLPSTALTAGGSCLEQARHCRGVLPVSSSNAASAALPRASPPQSSRGSGRPALAPTAARPPTSKLPTQAPSAAPPRQGRREPAPAPLPASVAVSGMASAGISPAMMAATPGSEYSIVYEVRGPADLVGNGKSARLLFSDGGLLY